jgi:hypothetical protein
MINTNGIRLAKPSALPPDGKRPIGASRLKVIA